jgi:hypothetical protein
VGKMVNRYQVQKWGCLLMGPMLCSIAFYVGIVFYNLLYAIGFLLGAVLVNLIIGVFLLKNPFTDLIEGKGILTLNLDSTGIIRPFISKVVQQQNTTYIKARMGRQDISDSFDRQAVFQLATPQKAVTPAVTKGDNIIITLDQDKYHEGRFSLYHYPVLLYNAQIGSIITKDFLSEQEKGAFAEHGVLYLNRKMEELTSVVRDFGRHVIESLKPKTSIFGSWIFWVVIAVIGVIGIALFGPAIWQQIQKFTGGGGSSTTSTTLPPITQNPIIKTG